ncbi:hypothetical protein F1D05_13230 [Kribbella qitaiheensis]|uniref:Uncharacterized protein n=1 Tax=Kribbella qitaiheensis TaxID=1544730 RepID=A0A7G6WXI1_9ACTN|nr:hypothetical protein [Kribbella qitaiheensis]QNE18696.1 hypothetical protein F1D05_13230 [Kribbella qitaiheensis]
MRTAVLTDKAAVDRLTKLGLDVETIHKVLRQADAEAATCTKLDPPYMGGSLRHGRTVRFLREELLPRDWDYDNPRNQCRIISPAGDFAVVASSGDAATGNERMKPTTKNPKGITIFEAVATNQLTFDLGSDFEPERKTPELLTWLLLYWFDDGEIRSELSLPRSMEGSYINDWDVRIIFPSVPRDPGPYVGAAPGSSDGDSSSDAAAYEVPVSRRA